jgi:phospholipid/cholesterol/gamma-HCH transport system substrate-binding protein
MIRRSVIVRGVIFAVIAVLGIGYVLVHYVGVADTLLGRQYTAYLDLPDSGGVFTTASVTYRGVEVGRVGPITLRPGGIRVELDLSTTYPIPSDVKAAVADGSPIGEQYVDLRPQTADTSTDLLHQGSVIQGNAKSLPVSSQDLLISLNRLLRSVPRGALRDLVGQLGAAFSDTGPSLRRLLDSTHSLVAAAQQDLPRTVGLLRSGGTVLDTQNQLSNDIVAFSRHLSQFTTTLRTHDGDVRALLRNGPPAASELTDLVHGVDATLPVLLGNLVSVGQVAQVRIPALRQVLIIYPYVVATSYGLFPFNHSTRFGVPLPPSEDGQPCLQGYIPASKRRLPSALKYPNIRYNSYCKSPVSSGVDPRGSREAPEPNGKRLGDEPSYRNNAHLPGGGSHTSASVQQSSERFTGPGGHHYLLASTGGEQRLMGDRSWTWLLFGPMS